VERKKTKRIKDEETGDGGRRGRKREMKQES
jgi:hypothetical protein